MNMSSGGVILRALFAMMLAVAVAGCGDGSNAEDPPRSRTDAEALQKSLTRVWLSDGSTRERFQIHGVGTDVRGVVIVYTSDSGKVDALDKVLRERYGGAARAEYEAESALASAGSD